MNNMFIIFVGHKEYKGSNMILSHCPSSVVNNTTRQYHLELHIEDFGYSPLSDTELKILIRPFLISPALIRGTTFKVFAINS